jgi:hypothetical protein
MRRVLALLVVTATLLVACGKYGPPRRVQRGPAASSPAQAEFEIQGDEVERIEAPTPDDEPEKNP